MVTNGASTKNRQTVKQFPPGWMKYEWVEGASVSIQQDGTEVINTSPIDRPDLLLWIRANAYPGMSVRQYRTSLRRLCIHGGAGYKASPLRRDIQDELSSRMNELGRRLWGCSYEVRANEDDTKLNDSIKRVLLRTSMLPRGITGQLHSVASSAVSLSVGQTGTFAPLAAGVRTQVPAQTRTHVSAQVPGLNSIAASETTNSYSSDASTATPVSVHALSSTAHTHTTASSATSTHALPLSTHYARAHATGYAPASANTHSSTYSPVSTSAYEPIYVSNLSADAAAVANADIPVHNVARAADAAAGDHTTGESLASSLHSPSYIGQYTDTVSGMYVQAIPTLQTTTPHQQQQYQQRYRQQVQQQPQQQQQYQREEEEKQQQPQRRQQHQQCQQQQQQQQQQQLQQPQPQQQQHKQQQQQKGQQRSYQETIIEGSFWDICSSVLDKDSSIAPPGQSKFRLVQDESQQSVTGYPKAVPVNAWSDSAISAATAELFHGNKSLLNNETEHCGNLSVAKEMIGGVSATQWDAGRIREPRDTNISVSQNENLSGFPSDGIRLSRPAEWICKDTQLHKLTEHRSSSEWAQEEDQLVELRDTQVSGSEVTHSEPREDDQISEFEIPKNPANEPRNERESEIIDLMNSLELGEDNVEGGYEAWAEHFLLCFSRPDLVCCSMVKVDRFKTKAPMLYQNERTFEFLGIDLTKTYHEVADKESLARVHQILKTTPCETGELLYVPELWLDGFDKEGNPKRILSDTWVWKGMGSHGETVSLYADPNDHVTLWRQPGEFELVLNFS